MIGLALICAATAALRPRLAPRQPCRAAPIRRDPDPQEPIPVASPRSRRPGAARRTRRRRLRRRDAVTGAVQSSPRRPSRKRSRRRRRRSKPRCRPTPRRRCSPTPPADRQGRRSLRGDRRRRRLADRHRAAQPGDKGPAVADLRRRLAIEGDLDAAPPRLPAQTWDADLTAAVKRFQARMGLRQTGIVAGATLKAINVPARRARSSSSRPARDRLAERRLFFRRALCRRQSAVDLGRGGRERRASSIATSRSSATSSIPRRRSPPISRSINLNPTWTVPTSIIKKEIIPRMQKDPGYLAREKIRILDGSGARGRSQVDRLGDRAGGQLHAAPGFGRRQFARRDPHRHAQQARRLHARHAVEAPVRRRLSLLQPWLRARAGRLRPRRMAAGRDARRPGGVWDKAALLAEVKDGAREDIKLAQPVAGDLGLSDRLGERRRRRAISATTSMASTLAGERRRAPTRAARGAAPPPPPQ